MSHLEKSRSLSLAAFNDQPSRLPSDVQRAIDPVTITLILDLVREIMSMFCPQATALQTAQSMKNPSKAQDRRHKKQIERETELKMWVEYDEPRPDRGGGAIREWKERRREFYRDQEDLIADTAARIYNSDRKMLDETPLEDVEQMVVEYRAKARA